MTKPDAVRAALVELVRLADTLEKAHNPTWDAAWNAARAALSEQPAVQTRSQQLAAAGFTRRPSLWAMQAREALELIAAPRRPDSTWNRDREACRQLAAEALGRDPDDQTPAPAEQTKPAVLSKVAAIAHAGGLVGLSEHEALVAIRRLTLGHYDRTETMEQATASVRAALSGEQP